MNYLCDDIIYLIGEEVKQIRRNEELKKPVILLQQIIRGKKFIKNFEKKTNLIMNMITSDIKFLYKIYGYNRLLVIDRCNYDDIITCKFVIKKNGFIIGRDILNEMIKYKYFKNKHIHDDNITLFLVKQYNEKRNIKPNKDICELLFAT
jgi:hypothetical protein